MSSDEIYHYWVQFIINNEDYFLIWVEDDKDYFLTDNGTLIFFKEFSNALLFSQKIGLDVFDSVAVYNTDEYAPVTKSSVNCSTILDFWNIISDVALSVKVPFDGDDILYNTIYGKLVYGCNLPSLSNGYHYDPTWNEEEIAILNKVLTSGLDILRSQLVSKKPFDGKPLTRDITEDFAQAKELGLFTSPQLSEAVDELSKIFPECAVDWDSGAGEDWIRFYDSTGGVCMLHTKIKIVFSVFEIADIKAKVVKVNNFNERDLSINLGEIDKKCPELYWHSSFEAVNPHWFNLNDLYFATV